jgi:putative DNA primase/helicase
MTSPTIDFAGLKAASLSSAESVLLHLFPAGKRDGREFRIGSLQGEPGTSLSVNLQSGVWCDFSSGEKGGDLIDLWAAAKALKIGEAARELADLLGTGLKPTKADVLRRERKGASDEWTAVEVAPADCAEPDTVHYKYGKPSMVWTYKDRLGRRAGIVCRYDEADGGKQVIPMSWCQHTDGREGWRFKAMARPRPLYGSDLLVEFPTKPVLVVEGEKTCDAARRLMPHIVCVSWAGGSKAIDLTDWSQLEGRKVVIWPDADEAGIGAALAIQGYLPQSLLVQFPVGVPAGWDLADAEKQGWTTAQVREAVKAAGQAAPVLTMDVPEVGGGLTDADVAEIAAQVSEAKEWQSEPLAAAAVWPFRLLGHDAGAYFYLPAGSQQVVSLTASEHKHLPLLRLAPVSFWEQTFPGQKGADWNAAANALIQRQHERGIYSPRKVRGRGCWLDAGAVVFHAGDRLFVNGKPVRLQDWDTAWIYEAGQAMEVAEGDALPNAEAARLLTLCELLPWKEPISAKFFAGWVVVSQICGVMDWRPHIWVNGPAGSGKTTVMNTVLHPLVGGVAVYVAADTTAPGIRQTIRSDALPVLFDESESEDRTGQARMQHVIELARQASSKTGASIYKGTTSGRAQEFRVASCFAFSSIGTAATQRADTGRITSLELKRPEPTEESRARFRDFKVMVADTVARPGFAEGLRQRSFMGAQAICANAKVFARAIAGKLGDQRIGDQLGALLAGAFSLTSTKELTYEQAVEWVERQDWSPYESNSADLDEVRALSWLMDKQVRFEADDKVYQRSIGELLTIYYADDVRSDEADNIAKNLMRHGIRVERDWVCVSNHHPALRGLFSETPWADKWKDQLARVAGAQHVPGVRIGASTHRAVRLPVSVIKGE